MMSQQYRFRNAKIARSNARKTMYFHGLDCDGVSKQTIIHLESWYAYDEFIFPSIVNSVQLYKVVDGNDVLLTSFCRSNIDMHILLKSSRSIPSGDEFDNNHQTWFPAKPFLPKLAGLRLVVNHTATNNYCSIYYHTLFIPEKYITPMAFKINGIFVDDDMFHIPTQNIRSSTSWLNDKLELELKNRYDPNFFVGIRPRALDDTLSDFLYAK